MMGKKSGQMQMVMIDIATLVPENHLLRKIDRCIDFSFIYEITKPYYSSKGRPSVDPVCMIKMLLVGYLYGIKSERRLEEEVTLNIAYRYFCGFELTDRIPDHSLFSQNRRRRFSDSTVFREIFNKIIITCIEKGIVTGETIVSDGSFIPGNISHNSKIEITEVIEKSSVHYLDALDEELKRQPGYCEPKSTKEEKTKLISSTDKDCGYINQGQKKGLGYLTEMTVDTLNGIVTRVDCYPANQRESDIILTHIDKQMQDTGLVVKDIALDAGYDMGAVHRGFELLGVTDYCSIREMHNNAMKKGFTYDEATDSFICEMGCPLQYRRLIYKIGTHNYYRLYSIPRKNCLLCNKLNHCAVDQGEIRINASSFYPAYYANRQRFGTAKYHALKRLRNIWSEGTFSVLKREHNLKRANKRGIHRVTEECLLAVLALNLKRIVKVTDYCQPRRPAGVLLLGIRGFFTVMWFCCALI